MIPVARLGDKTIGVCKCHSPNKDDMPGTIVSASSDTFVNMQGVARMGDLIKADCGHYARIITASSDSFINELGVARLNDKGEGDCYSCRIVTASPDTFTY